MTNTWAFCNLNLIVRLAPQVSLVGPFGLSGDFIIGALRSKSKKSILRICSIAIAMSLTWIAWNKSADWSAFLTLPLILLAVLVFLK